MQPVIEFTVRSATYEPAASLNDDRTELIGYRTFPAAPPELVEDWQEDIFGRPTDRAARIIANYRLDLLRAEAKRDYNAARYSRTIVLTFGHKDTPTYRKLSPPPNTCPDCGADLQYNDHPRLTTCACPRCNGAGTLYLAMDNYVAWTPAR